MRPVNLIPPEERVGERGPSRTGIAAYLLMGGLVAVLLAVTMVVLTGNSISSKKSERARLEAEQARVEAEATKLGSYTQFKVLLEKRRETITSLAQSRFDWQRVLREMAIVLPRSVYLTGLTGTSTPNVDVANGTDNALRGAIQGPALEITGCGRDQSAVAIFMSRLDEIDGVTKVAVTKSDKGGQANSNAGALAAAVCKAGEAKFDAVASLEGAAPPAAVAPGSPTAAAASTSSSSSPATPASSGGSGL